MTSKLERYRIEAFTAIGEAVLETIKEAGKNGAPAGPLYAALMQAGFGLSNFEHLMKMLVEAGRIRKVGNVYYYVERG